MKKISKKPAENFLWKLAIKEMIKVIHGRTQRKVEWNRSVRSALKGGTWYLIGAVASLVITSYH